VSVHNGLARLTDVQRGAKIALGLDSGEGGLERLSESIQVTRDLWGDPYVRHLLNERSFQGYAEVGAGGAGTYSSCAFSCNTAGWIALLERIEINLQAGGVVYLLRGVPQPTPSAYRQPRDTRQLTLAPIAQITQDATAIAAPAGVICTAFRILAATPLTVPLDWVFALVSGSSLPYRALVVYNAATNVSLEVNFYWRERSLLPGELAL
jgi:hypothetical protein